MADNLRIAVEAKDEAVVQMVHTGLRAFNRTRADWPERQYFNVTLREPDGVLRGGILASVNFDVLVLEDVYIEDDRRSGGYGARMMAAAEREGLKRGARLAVVSTFSWQARPFYEKCGYSVYAELPYNDGAYTLFSLKKWLCA
ncbi:MAG TPA: GNAT family N-acetyltransferase [Rhizomicrobium sp.]|nr:GNAT family N-acetyltransferase [Rhizomicrobium sp.]